jgi:uncharacterized protein YdeI (YjbR/CyaY-like superfamily)
MPCPAIRAVCANEFTYETVHAVPGNQYPYRDRELLRRIQISKPAETRAKRIEQFTDLVERSGSCIRDPSRT